METENELLQINQYYRDQLQKALNVMDSIKELEEKYHILLPDYVQDEVNDFVDNFKFK